LKERSVESDNESGEETREETDHELLDGPEMSDEGFEEEEESGNKADNPVLLEPEFDFVFAKDLDVGVDLEVELVVAGVSK